MKYSYIPTQESYGKSVVGEEVNKGYLYWIDSDERILDFRNQYGETFVLAPRKVIWCALIVAFIVGIFIGKLI